MHIIKVDAIDSTNTFLRKLYREKQYSSPVCVIAKRQLEGKGQMGTIWQSNFGENLTCSVFMPIEEVFLKDQFFISMSTALAVMDTMRVFMVPKLSIKWPNDILSGKQKICGILIENIVKNGSLSGAILGIGLNVNQMEFDNLPQAGSLKQILGKKISVEEVASVLLKNIENRFIRCNPKHFEILKTEYENVLFRKNNPSTFKNIEGDYFVGIIQAVTNIGKLRLLLEDNVIKDYDLKEVKMLY